MSAAAARRMLRVFLVLLVALGNSVADTATHAVDALVLEASGTTLRGQGWFSPADIEHPSVAIDIIESVEARRVRVESVGRPDVIAALLIGFALAFGGYHWLLSIHSGTPATVGTVMLPALAMVSGLQFLLAFLAYDIGTMPRRALHPLLSASRRHLETQR